ncbi:MAG TPA: cytochrome C biogenesis protein [Legionella sp.]|nr:cytochrome C biogenesis protein [Legionella sp.]
MDYKDYYKVMGLTREATPKDIKLAYRRLARKYHPDLNKDKGAEEKFKALGEAYEALKDPEKRKVYDQYARDWELNKHAQHSRSRPNPAYGDAGMGGFQSTEDFFESLFGQRPFREQHAKGGDLVGNVSISLEEAYQGTVKELQLPATGPSPTGTQTLRVKIPAGVKSGQQLRLTGQGQAGPAGGAKGDLLLTIQVNKHPLFDVMNHDVYITLPITPWEAALGTQVMVPTLGGKVDLKIPAGSQGGQTLRLKKRGLPGVTPGDQYILLKIIIPQPTTDAARSLYQSMAEQMPFNPRESMGV